MYTLGYTTVMGESILISGGNKRLRKEKVMEYVLKSNFQITPNNPDIIEIDVPNDKKTIGIDAIRDLIKFSNTKPFSHKIKWAVIYNANKMTVEAQNALLKTLEEPENYFFTALETRSEELLLPTIVSRCKRIKIKNILEDGQNNSIKLVDLLNLDIGKRLEWAEETAKLLKPEIINILDSWLIEGHLNIHNTDSKVLNRIIKVRTDLDKTNVNTKLALEYLVILLQFHMDVSQS